MIRKSLMLLIMICILPGCKTQDKFIDALTCGNQLEIQVDKKGGGGFYGDYEVNEDETGIIFADSFEDTLSIAVNGTVCYNRYVESAGNDMLGNILIMPLTSRQTI